VEFNKYLNFDQMIGYPTEGEMLFSINQIIQKRPETLDPLLVPISVESS